MAVRWRNLVFFPSCEAARVEPEPSVGSRRTAGSRSWVIGAIAAPPTPSLAGPRHCRRAPPQWTQKIGHPEKFREYPFAVKADDYLGNVRRAAAHEWRRQVARVGKAVDRAEWRMTPQTVNAYFSPLQNEIVFPAGILQPPFFDLAEIGRAHV